MGCPSSLGFIAHNVKVSVQSRCKMHQENHPGIRFCIANVPIKNMEHLFFFADNPCF